MSISRTTDKNRRIPTIVPAGRRWMSVDEWLKRYDQHRDPNGVYGTPGRDPQNVITTRSAA